MKALRLLAAGSMLLVACGDGPICPSEIVVVIGSPSGNVTEDNGSEDGVQTDVSVRSNLQEGDLVTLTVLDENDEEVTSYQGAADDEGNASFEVTLPTGDISLRATGTSDRCSNSGSDEVGLFVGNQNCVVTIREGPTANSFYGLPVLNAGHDTDADTPGFQGNVDVETVPGYEVELFVLDTSETSVGTATANESGVASLAVSLNEGQSSLRAVCDASDGSVRESSLSSVVFVDTEVPSCTLEPAAGTTIIPPMDIDEDPSNDTQVTLAAHVEGDDVEGEPAQFTFDGDDLSAPDLDANGESSVTATFDTPSPPDVQVMFQGQDHAENTCNITRSYAYQIEGCPITITEPADVLTAEDDANGDTSDGIQHDLPVDVGADCGGKTVTTDCGVQGTATGDAPAGGGTVDIRVTLCEEAECETSIECTASVTDDANFTTFDGATLEVDTKPPFVSLDLLQPSNLACDTQFDPSIDYDGDSGNGVQIRVRANDLGQSETRSIAYTPPGGSETSISVDATTGETDVTLESGDNGLAAVATDANGNTSRNPVPDCIISLVDIAVGFDPDIADGVVGASDGSVSGSDLTFDICGTVSREDVTVEVSIDGETAQGADVTGNDWCLNDVTLSEGNHTITATATDGGAMGSNSIDPLVVDLTPPNTPSDPLAEMVNRQEALFSWTSPQDGGPDDPASSYIVKFATEELTDANFDSVGIQMSAPSPSQPGTTDSASEVMLRPGIDYFFGVVALDDAGNRSGVASAGPLPLDFTPTGQIDPFLSSEDAGWHQLGWAVTGGDFNGDGFADVAVGAPWTDLVANSSLGDGVVYVYLGQTDGSGIDPSTPTFIIEPIAGDEGLFGHALTTMRWDGDSVDDLVVGAPFQDDANGRVSVFFGGSLFDPDGTTPPITLSQETDADVEIISDGGGDFFSAARLGFALSSGRFNSSDSRDDLIIGFTRANNGRGGAMILFGGTTDFGTNDDLIVLSDSNDAEMGKLRAFRITFDSEPNGSTFGSYLFNLGGTEGLTDQTEDFGIAPFADPSDIPNRTYVFRGRASLPSEGINELVFDSAKDLSVTDETDDSTSKFAATMGTVRDLNGDGAREIVISDSFGASSGYVTLVDGDATGHQDVGDLEIARLTGGGGVGRFGDAAVNNQPAADSDVDNDGLDDLLVTGRTSSGAHLFVWYGDNIPTSGTFTAASSSDHVIDAPADFGAATIASWIGDVNGDELADVCWADPHITESGAELGAFEVLWD